MRPGESYDNDGLRDAAIIGAAQRVEHYEIAAYGTAIARGRLLERAALAAAWRTDCFTLIKLERGDVSPILRGFVQAFKSKFRFRNAPALLVDTFDYWRCGIKEGSPQGVTLPANNNRQKFNGHQARRAQLKG